MKRFGSATWNGGLREGKGSVSTESGDIPVAQIAGWRLRCAHTQRINAIGTS